MLGGNLFPPCEFPLCNLKPASIHGGQGETEENGSLLQIDRWQV